MEAAPAPTPANMPPVMPSPKQQSWGAFISIIIIMLMILVGAFYAWGKRVNEQNTLSATTTDQL